MKMVTWVLPEKIKWKVFKGGKNKKNKGKPICSGGPYNKWYSTIPMDCNLKKGTYTIDCMDAKGFGWGEGKDEQVLRNLMQQGDNNAAEEDDGWFNIKFDEAAGLLLMGAAVVAGGFLLKAALDGFGK